MYACVRAALATLSLKSLPVTEITWIYTDHQYNSSTFHKQYIVFFSVDDRGQAIGAMNGL